MAGAHQEPTFEDLVDLARRVIAAFDEVEQRSWTIEVTLIELMKQIGDLAKHVLMHEHYYLPERASNPNYRTDIRDIGDELADIFYCLIRVADHYDIDLAQAHVAARQAELRNLGITDA